MACRIKVDSAFELQFLQNDLSIEISNKPAMLRKGHIRHTPIIIMARGGSSIALCHNSRKLLFKCLSTTLTIFYIYLDINVHISLNLRRSIERLPSETVYPSWFRLLFTNQVTGKSLRGMFRKSKISNLNWKHSRFKNLLITNRRVNWK